MASCSGTQTVLQSEEEIQAAYGNNDVAKTYIDRRFIAPLMALLHRRQVAAVNSVMTLLRPADALEIAPGPGRITRYVDFPGRLTCLEYNAAMIEEGQIACRDEVRWIEGNAFEMEFERQFDFIYSFRFIRHFDSRDRDRLYGRVAAALRPGGLFMMDAVNERISLPLRQACPKEYTIYDKLYRNLDEVAEELAPHKLIFESAAPVLKRFTAQRLVQNIVGPRCEWLCRSLIAALETIPSRSPLEWIVRCRRA
jgi:ubiquinone/menaquinone biosynthesis C-methylase UbiE